MTLKSTILNKYPTVRKRFFIHTAAWMAGKRADDNAEGLWRVHDKLYDVSKFIENHPGGSEWLEISKGLDITELFESHHISHKAEEILQKFFVRDAALPRNSKLTFHPNGFYKTLKRRVAKELPNLKDDDLINKSQFYCDLIFVCLIFSFIYAARNFSLISALIAALCLAMLVNVTHNFGHQRDNWRMYLMNFSMATVRIFRVYHILSHHMYPNSLLEIDHMLKEPLINYMVTPKNFFQRKISWMVSLIIPVIFYPLTPVYRIVSKFTDNHKFHWDDLIPFTVPILMWTFGSVSFYASILRWLLIITLSSILNGLLFLSNHHIHDELFHDGDTLKSLDFGMFQLSTTIERIESQKNFFTAITTYGDHTLHHLFPALDQTKLLQLKDITEYTCKEFGVEIRFRPWYELFMGQWRQVSRTTPKLV